MNTSTAWTLTKDTISGWNKDKALKLGAALSYYTVFSLAPLLIIVIAIAGLIFGNDVAQSRIMDEIRQLVGANGANAVAEMLQHASKPSTGILATFIGLVTLLLGATGVVGELKDDLNIIWDVPEKEGSGIMTMVRTRLVSFAMVLGIGFLLIVSLVASAALSALGTFFHLGAQGIIFQSLNFLLSLAVISLLFAVLLKYLPDVHVRWRNVWIGAVVTAVLFTIGKTLTGIYIGKSAVASTFGAAGSLVVILVWVYYSSQILFIGAEFTQAYTRIRKRQMKEHTDHVLNEVEDTSEAIAPGVAAPADNSLISKAARFSGYQKAKIEHRMEPVKEELKKDGTMAKWGYRIVKFLGIQRSAKLGWKGYKAKKKIDRILTPEDTPKQAPTKLSASSFVQVNSNTET